MKCPECTSTMTKSVGDHVYRESGMDHVVLRNIAKFRCDSCGHEMVQIDRIAQLHRLLAELLAGKPARLIPSEVRFLRDHLDLTNKDFAQLMGVTESQASRWTSSDPIGSSAEYLLRLYATMGPLVLASREHPEAAAGKISEGKLVADIANMIGKLPPREATAEKLAVNIRRTSSDWKAEPMQVAG